ncbi:MAG TPA: lipase family protein [Gammaproteobacteria bacterium]|nr:lipase family protein [Gammaproteobacteria bacterium]
MYFDNKSLLKPPVSRAAYSDRTAWLMVEMARLAYFKFEGSVDIDDIAATLTGESDPQSIKKMLEKLLSDKQQLSDNAEAELASYLTISDFVLSAVFNVDGTQAFLATSKKYRMNVLSFRGTEADIRDIKADLKATTVEIDGYQIHSGFYQAFCNVKTDIEAELESLKDNGYPLYITGHSLGGALALCATKFLASDSLGACYTFGSPRVASSGFGDDIKTPIYRVVNAADLVPRVPPAYIQYLLISIFEVAHIPFVSEAVVKILEKTVGYRHHGDMRFLTASKNTDHSDLRVLKNPTIIDRAIRLFNRLIVTWGKAGATDHFIKTYSNKLSAYAVMRNKK